MIDPGVEPDSSWPVFAWLAQQVGNFQTLGVLVMVALMIFGIIKWVGGNASEHSARTTGGKVMVFGAILGGVAIAAAPALITWATSLNIFS